MTLEGIDVSAANPVPRWDLVPDEIAFCGIRATYGHARDGRLAAHWNAAVMASRPTFAYSFMYADDDPADEVAAFIDTDAINMVLPPVLDMETLNNRSVPDVLKYARAWLDAVEKASSHTPGIYTGPAFWMSLGALGKDPSWARYPLWIAHYGVTKPVIPAPWTEALMWQYAGNTIRSATGAIIAPGGVVPGVVGEVDRDRFFGSADDLRALVGIPAAR